MAPHQNGHQNATASTPPQDRPVAWHLSRQLEHEEIRKVKKDGNPGKRELRSGLEFSHHCEALVVLHPTRSIVERGGEAGPTNSPT
jgi:hypothetical protein